MVDLRIQNNLYYVILLVIFIIVFGFIFVLKLNSEKDRKLELIIGISASVSIVLVMYNMIITTHSNIRIEKNRNAHITLENIQRNWLAPQIELSQNYPEGFFLFKSMTPDADHGTYEPMEYDPAKRMQIEIAASIRIFQAIEDFLTIGTHGETGTYVWINNFLMWLQSPILKNNWNTLSFNYSSDTRELIELLILESDKLIVKRKKNGTLISQDYDDVSKKIKVNFR
jgi:hypothetical protein